MRLPPLLAVVALAGCARGAMRSPASPPSPASPAVADSSSSSSRSAPVALPPIPLVVGPLAPQIVYPEPDQLITSRDSNFIFGSVGNGHATLTINGTPVRVLPNGSFIAYLPNPAPDLSRYDLVAVLGADTARLSRQVRLPHPVPALLPTGPLVVDSSSITPAGTMALGDSESVRVSIRAPQNATVLWRGDSGATAALVNGAVLPGPHPGAVGSDTGASARYAGDSTTWATSLPAHDFRSPTELLVARGDDTLHFALPAIALPPPAGTWGILGADSTTVSDTDRVIIGRSVPEGTYKWFLMPGTAVPITGWSNEFVRVRLDEALQIWVKESDIRLLPAGYSPPPRTAGNARLIPAPDWVDFVIPMSSRPPFLVEEGDHMLSLTLYDVHGNTDILGYTANDSLVRVVSWDPVASDRVRYTLHLATQPYGYLAFWDRGSFVLRVRRPPRVNPAHPLAGLTIAVDPGHPPIGATGPTGLWEPVPTLAVGEQVKTMLEQRGATVVMTRTTPAPVALGDRPIIARRANANALVSIHLNALPDGVNPFHAYGTGTYFFHPQSAPLARALQRGMVRHMGLPNLGIYYDNLALARPTWMPAALCEGAFIMMPDEEAALRTPQFQAAYARGIVDGLENYFRSLAMGAATR